MIITFAKPDILSIITYLSTFSSGLSIYYSTVKDSITITSTINITRKVSIGNLKLSLVISVTSGGMLELDIKSVSLNGVSIGFLVRGVVNNYLVKELSFPGVVAASRSTSGNITLNIYRVYFNSVKINNGVIIINLKESKEN